MMVRLGWVRVKEYPAGLEPPADANNRRKAYCENTKKLATSDSTRDPNKLHQEIWPIAIRK